MRRPPQAPAAELMNTLRQAVAEAARRQADIVEAAPVAPSPPRRPTPEPHDDFSEQNIMRGNSWNERSSRPPPPQVRSEEATKELSGKSNWEMFRSNPVTRMNSHDGIVGERMQQGFWKPMGDAVGNEALAQGTIAHEKGARNRSLREQAAESRATGTDHSKQRIEGFLDI